MSEQTQTQPPQKKELGALWGPKYSHSGKEYFTGYIEDEHKQRTDFIMFSNNKTGKDGVVNNRAPDFRIYAAAPPGQGSQPPNKTSKNVDG
jgi:uncharacterized protein (DUF736 family)